MLTHTREDKLIQLSSGHRIIPEHEREGNVYGPHLFPSCLHLCLSHLFPILHPSPSPLLFPPLSPCFFLLPPFPSLSTLPPLPSTPSLPLLLSSHLVIWQSSLRTSLCSMGLPLRRLNSTSSWIKFCCTSGCLVWGVSERALRSVIQCSVAAEEHPKHLP